MSRMQEDIQYAGSDTRPPMLDRTDFESWQQRIRLYCLGKDNGENIMKSIKEGPFQMGTVSDVITGGTEGAVQQGPVRARVLNDLSAEEKERYKADIRATNILLQGIPKDIYSLINHYTDAKDIWENVKMILEGSELTKDDRESQLYDESLAKDEDGDDMLLDVNENDSIEPKSGEGLERLKEERVDERLLEKIDISFALTIDVHVIISRQRWMNGNSKREETLEMRRLIRSEKERLEVRRNVRSRKTIRSEMTIRRETKRLVVKENVRGEKTY
ncbi:hypothetical protein Tco_0686855 [Tanacetum coccineum]